MLESEHEIIQNLFNEYVKRFSLSNNRLVLEPNLKLKYDHTKRVCELISFFADSLKMDKSETNLALSIGRLHDIGRFFQLYFHQTYSDHDELDHAKLGVKIINDHNIISHISEHEQEIVLSSVSYHNVKKLPTVIPTHIRPFVALLRDADKLDIIKIAIDHFLTITQQKKSNLEYIICEVSLDKYCSSKVIDDVVNHRVVSFTDINTIYDEMLMHLSWIETLNFDCSTRYYLKAGYIDFIISILPEVTLKTRINEYVEYVYNKYDTKNSD